MKSVKELAQNAKKAADFLASADTKEKNMALCAIANALCENADAIIEKNNIDIKNATESGMSDALIDRLLLTKDRIYAMAEGCREVAKLNDPCNLTLDEFVRPNGIRVKKITCPMGVIGIIYESRPNVTSDAAALCLKSGNATVLRGGKEAINSNIAIANTMRQALKSVGFPEDAVCLVEDTSRNSAGEMMSLKGLIDVLIPRGGKNLIAAVCNNATVPVIETGSGNCHIYVDESADIQMAANIVFNAKTQRIGVCNACESLVIHKNILKKALPAIKLQLDKKNVEIRGDAAAQQCCDGIVPATDEDFFTEYLDYIISVKTVNNLDEAINHINKCSTGHSEAIITENQQNAEEFLRRIDSAAVYVNASTRFTDGGEFGLGAEIGISTQKLHARGPMGLRELTTTKYLIFGNGQVR